MLSSYNGCNKLELIYVIVNFGMGSKIVKYAKQYGARGGTIFLGKGTIKNSLLQLLELNETRKEIVLLAAEKAEAYNVMEELNRKFDFKKPNHGIVFSLSIMKILGSKTYTCTDIEKDRGDEKSMHNIIFAVVDKGRAELAIEAAVKAGSKGGTIINARGSGVHETSRLFSMDIEPEREIVLIISEADKTEAIAESISKELEMDKPGNGILFIQEVNKTYGLY